MVKCGACGKFLSQNDTARCDKCGGTYHRACVGIPLKGVFNSPWHCPECKKHQVRDNQTDTPIRGALHCSNVEGDTCVLPPPDLCAQLGLFKEELLAEVRRQFQLFRDDLLELRTSIKSCNDRLDDLTNRVEGLEKHHDLREPFSSATNEIVEQLRLELNERDQELLLNDIEIANLPEVNGENPTHTAVLIAAKLGVNIEARDVVSAERVGRRIDATQSGETRPPRPRALIVRLARRATRDELLQAARVRRGATSADLQLPGPPRRFYINERLTKENRMLFRKARELASDRGWRFVWTKRGRIYARNKAGDSVCPIRCATDFQRVFGPEAPNN